MSRRTVALSTIALATALVAGFVAPSAASAAPAPAPCPTQKICVYGGQGGELLAAHTLAGWAGRSVSLYTSKIVNNTQTPVTVTLSQFDTLESWEFGQAVVYETRVAAKSSATVFSLDARNIRAAR